MQTQKANSFFLVLCLFIFLSSHIQISGKIIKYDDEKEEDEMDIKRSVFPEDFIFGTATSAYQIEGAYLEDGKSLNNWDVFTSLPGTEPNGDTGNIADDHYHRYMEDIENIHSVGVDAYRFSISWSRILPNGRFGKVNPSGVTFYNTIINNLLLRGIEPFVTIHHNDIPQELEERYGGWLSPQIQDDFVHFAKTCFEEFGDRVKNWITINEPNIYVLMAYILGQFPPGHCSQPFGNCPIGNSDLEPLIAGHNMILSHAKAVKLYRDHFQHKGLGKIGLAIHAFNYVPYRDDEFSREAVERAFSFDMGWYMDPLVYGDYPSLMHKYLGNNLPKFTKEEKELLKGSLDFIGINHYSTLYAIDCFNYGSECKPGENRPIKGFVGSTGYRDGLPIGDETGYDRFFVVPPGMEKLIDYFSTTYPNTTLYVTENGYTPIGKAKLQDVKRINYHKGYLAALAKAMRNGANVRGYFAWTLMDNFEWLQGYTVSYGLFYVDRNTLERTPKLSAKWYTNFLANNTHTNTQQYLHKKSSRNSSFSIKNIVGPTSFNEKRVQ